MTESTEGTAAALQGAGEVAAPAPVPEPAPPAGHLDPEVLLHELASHIRVVAASADRDISEVMAFLASHGL